ncbi:MAG TPA: hypothetical protein VLB83_04360 [Candidatus Paceibacterota bacterium]|nr:hypothetical protein [Candidatus Paceibacterota bacterium]
MQKNHVYNLMEQCAQEHKSLWRITSDYLKDAKGHADEIAFWKKMAKDKKEHIAELEAMLAKRLKK